MDETLRRQYLHAMGIEQWVVREKESVGEAAAESGAQVPAVEPQQSEAVTVSDDSVRVDPAADASIPPWLDEVPPPLEEWAEETGFEEQANLAPDQVATLDWHALAQRVANCEQCPLHAGRSNTVFGVGDQNADLMVIGEAPGAEEDRQGEPFVGRAGQLLNAMLLAVGVQRSQVYIANILKCRPPDNRDPRPEEVIRCEPYLRRQLALVRPKVILAVGRVAAQNLLKSEEAVGRMRGKDYRFDGIPVVVTYHPAYLLRSPDQKGRAWHDLQRTIGLLRP